MGVWLHYYIGVVGQNDYIITWGVGYAQMITILHGGGSLGTPKSDYVICARPLNRSSGWAVFVTKGHKITQILILKPNIFWKHVFLKTSSHYFALFATQHFARLAKNDLQQQLAKAKIWLGTIICKIISRMTLQDFQNDPKLQFAK